MSKKCYIWVTVTIVRKSVLKRIITLQGRSRAYINGSMVNVQTLSDISRDIIDVHGQYEPQSLLSPQNQLDILDAYGGFIPARQEG